MLSPFPPSSRPAGEMVSVLCKELQAVAAGVPAEEVERAKAAAVSQHLPCPLLRSACCAMPCWTKTCHLMHAGGWSCLCAQVSGVLMNLESRAVVAEDIGRQVLTYGHRCAGAASCAVGGLGWLWVGALPL